ncbi:bifunctional 5,10-methylenetetrahydrofolate dehydrogenase/5,10-methenyltetrahydrofolate cyclohydrolase [Halobellus sp. EA9]|uniref:bifunctional 5,10-methylenetetrahydrofolate dehydrogenase/5,10-methenyltetrahydrofolate cyclohydrolase n=1 Tax=Halobellus sp. EA9 TaxID=3421647 RepID=UPI003EC0CB8C
MQQESEAITIDGTEVSERVRGALGNCVATLDGAGVTPRLATVRMADDGASKTYVTMKRQACAELGIESDHHEIDSGASAAALFDRIDRLNDDDAVDGVLVQLPLPDHVDEREVFRRIRPEKDVDAFHPENVGRLVAGEPRYRPCTPHGIQKLLRAYDVDPAGKDAVVVGRSNVVGRPTANLLLRRAPGGDATVTVCHSRTQDLAAKTRTADILIAAAGEPELIDGEMLAEGVVIVDVGINRVSATERGPRLVGDVDFDSAKEKASAITPVPGGVGPMTVAMLLYNTVAAASERSGVAVDLP